MMDKLYFAVLRINGKYLIDNLKISSLDYNNINPIITEMCTD